MVMRTLKSIVVLVQSLALVNLLFGPAGAAERRVPSGWVGGADMLLGIGLPGENPLGGDFGLSPAVQGQLRLGHEIGRAARWGRVEGVLAGFATHPSGISSWGVDSTYALQGYGGLRYTTPLFKFISLNAGAGYGGLIAFGTPPGKLLPMLADGTGAVVTAGLDIGFRWVGLVVEVDHFFTTGELTYVMGGIRFGR